MIPGYPLRILNSMKVPDVTSDFLLMGRLASAY